jgi:hypothetical protein
MYAVKWRNFKLVLVERKSLSDPALPLGFPRIVSLMTDPKDREPFNPVHVHSWTLVHTGRIPREFMESVAREPVIPAGAPMHYQPASTAK